MEVNPVFISRAKDIIVALGLKPTANRMQFMYAWISGENTKAKNNPLATTYDIENLPASVENFNYNSGYPVKNYSTWAIGLKATVKTLLNGYYPEILRFLKHDIPIGQYTDLLVKNLKTWGTGMLPITIWGKWTPEFKKKISMGMAIGAGSLLLLFGAAYLIYNLK